MSVASRNAFALLSGSFPSIHLSSPFFVHGSGFSQRTVGHLRLRQPRQPQLLHLLPQLVDPATTVAMTVVAVAVALVVLVGATTAVAAAPDLAMAEMARQLMSPLLVMRGNAVSLPASVC